jgi:hypothetical protein
MAKKGDVLQECRHCGNRFYGNLDNMDDEKEFQCPKCKEIWSPSNKCCLCGIMIDGRSFCNKCSEIIIKKIDSDYLFDRLNLMMYENYDENSDALIEGNEIVDDILTELAEQKVKVTQINKSYNP